MLKMKFTAEYRATIGASMVKIPYVPKEAGPVKWFYFWDTGGMEKYRSLAPIYYRDSCAALIVYDVTERQTFAQLDTWLRLYRESCGKSNPVIVIGNKIDLNKRQVEESEGKEYATEHMCEFMEVSAKTGHGIDRILVKLDALLEGSNAAVRMSTQQAVPNKQKCCG
jgi:small GTP-binding protein